MIDSTVDKISFIRTLCSRFVKKSRINLHSIGDTFRVLSLLITISGFSVLKKLS